MNVTELIDLLLEMPLEAEIRAYGPDIWQFESVTGVILTTNSVAVQTGKE